MADQQRYLAFTATFGAPGNSQPLVDAVAFCTRVGIPMAIAAESSVWHPNTVYEMFDDGAPGRAAIRIPVHPRDLDRVNDILDSRHAGGSFPSRVWLQALHPRHYFPGNRFRFLSHDPGRAEPQGTPSGSHEAADIKRMDRELRKLLSSGGYCVKLRIAPEMFAVYPYLRSLQTLDAEQRIAVGSLSAPRPQQPDIVILVLSPADSGDRDRASESGGGSPELTAVGAAAAATATATATATAKDVRTAAAPFVPSYRKRTFVRTAGTEGI